MRLSIEEAACQILQTLQQRLRHAMVEYESFGGTHYFYVEHGGVRFNLRFPEAALQRKHVMELHLVVGEIMEQITRITPHASSQFSSVLTMSFMESARTNGSPYRGLIA